MHPSRSDRLENQPILPLLLSFSVPAIVGMMVQAAYNVVDRIFIGRAVGSLGISAVTITFPIMLSLMAFAMLVGLGATALISIRLGQRKKEEAESVLGNALTLLVVSSLALTVIGWILLDPLLNLFGASPAILPMAKGYTRIILLGAVFQGIGFGLNNVIRGEGNPMIAMATMLIGAVLNIVLDALFIFHFEMGVQGAALATVISQLVTTVWVLAYFRSGKSVLVLRWANLWLRPRLCRSILAIGSPPFAVQLAASLLIGILNNQLALHGGDLAIAAFGIVHSLVMFIFMPVFGISQGAQPIIGFNYGAQNFHRVKKTLLWAVLAASAVTTLGFILAMFFPSEMVGLFDNKDEKLIALGSHAMRICFLMFPIIGFQVISAHYFQAIGKPKQAMFLSLSRQVILLLPGLLIWPRYFGLDGVWMALPISDALSSLLTGAWLFFEIRGLREKHDRMKNNSGTVLDQPAEKSEEDDSDATGPEYWNPTI